MPHAECAGPVVVALQKAKAEGIPLDEAKARLAEHARESAQEEGWPDEDLQWTLWYYGILAEHVYSTKGTARRTGRRAAR